MSEKYCLLYKTHSVPYEGNVLHGCEMFNGMLQHDSYIYNWNFIYVNFGLHGKCAKLFKTFTF